MARVALYGRVSSHKQEQVESIETQRFYLEEWAQSNGHQVVDWYGDEDVESHIPVPDRPEGGRLLRDAARGRFDKVVIYRLGRWSRYTSVWHAGRRHLTDCGVELVCLNEDMSEETPSDRFSLGVKLLVGEYDRDQIRQTCLDGRYRRVHEGGYVGGVVPFGFTIVGERRRTYAIDEAEAAIVRMIFRWLVEENASTRNIALRLNAQGLRSPCASPAAGRHRGHMPNAAGHWRPSSVAYLVRNPIYQGLGRYGGGNGRDVVGFRVPAIVDAQTWQLAQMRLAENSARSPRNRKQSYLLTGLIHCVHCNRHCHGRASRGRGGRLTRYYVCPRRCDPARNINPRLGACRLPYVAADRLEEDVWNTLLPYLLDCDETGKLLRDEMARADEQADALLTRSDELRAALSRKDASRRRAVSLGTDGLISREELSEQTERLDAESEVLRQELADVVRRMATAKEREHSLHGAEQYLAVWRAQLSSPIAWETRREAVAAFVRRIDVSLLEDGTRLDFDYVLCFSD